MMQPNAPVGLIFNAYLPLFEELAARLAAEPWWDERWTSRAGYFDEGIYFQLYRDGWHNESLRGIHLETWITLDGLASMSLPVVLHIEPETPERERFTMLLADRASALMAGWPGRVVPVEHDPTERYVLRLSLTLPDLLDSLVAEFRRMQEIGAVVDDLLGERSARYPL